MDREISLSLINSFQKCKYLWYLGYERSIKPVRRPTPVALGGLVHIGLAAALAGKDFAAAIHDVAVVNEVMVPKDTDGETFVVDSMVDTEKLVADAVSITAKSFKFLFENGEWETVSIEGIPLIEVKLGIPLNRTETFVGVVDWVAKERQTNTVWLFDHKTRTHLQPDELEDYNVQMAVYQRLLWSFDVHPVGSITFQIRSSVPAWPKRNKDGSMSRADIATDWETYRAALVDANLDPDDYADMQYKLDQKEFYRLSKAYRSDALVEAIWQSSVLDVLEDVKHTRNKFRKSKDGKVPSRNQHLVNCKLCASREFCQAELRGLDAEYLVQSGQFVRKEE